MKPRTAGEVYRMLGNDAVWKTAKDCEATLSAAGVPHALLGGLAVCLHGYQRNTTNVDVLVRRADIDAVHKALSEAGFKWHAERGEFLANGGVSLRLVMAHEPAGKGNAVLLPNPSDPAVSEKIEGLTVLRLAKLIEGKIAHGCADERRRYKDYADVIELIIVNELDMSFASGLHMSLRRAFHELRGCASC